LGLDDFFKQQNCDDWLTIFKVLIISRFYHPSSELHIAEHLYEHSAMEDFFDIPAAKIYDNRLRRELEWTKRERVILKKRRHISR
jgi:hypothetical protein